MSDVCVRKEEPNDPVRQFNRKPENESGDCPAEPLVGVADLFLQAFFLDIAGGDAGRLGIGGVAGFGDGGGDFVGRGEGGIELHRRASAGQVHIR